MFLWFVIIKNNETKRLLRFFNPGRVALFNPYAAEGGDLALLKDKVLAFQNKARHKKKGATQKALVLPSSK